MKLISKQPTTLFDISDTIGHLIQSVWIVEVFQASYNWKENIASISLLCKEKNSNFEHVRTFEIPADGEVTSRDIEARVGEFLGPNFELINQTP